VTENVDSVNFDAQPFELWIGDPNAPEPTVRAHAVIVSTGAQSLMLGLENEYRLVGQGVSTCATCDGFFFRDHDIAVVGGGDSAIEEALFLTKFARSVTIVHRRDELRASKIMQDRAFANDKIRFMWDSVVVGINGADSLESLEIEHSAERPAHRPSLHRTVRRHRPQAEHRPVRRPARHEGERIPRHRSRHDPTNVPGVFACGDVQDDTYRQAITAAGSGCMAAIDAERWLEAHH
jgi:thioredoxin reductase (NADPH)